jgi:hypothetical protein
LGAMRQAHLACCVCCCGWLGLCRARRAGATCVGSDHRSTRCSCWRLGVRAALAAAERDSAEGHAQTARSVSGALKVRQRPRQLCAAGVHSPHGACMEIQLPPALRTTPAAPLTHQHDLAPHTCILRHKACEGAHLRQRRGLLHPDWVRCAQICWRVARGVRTGRALAVHRMAHLAGGFYDLEHDLVDQIIRAQLNTNMRVTQWSNAAAVMTADQLAHLHLHACHRTGGYPTCCAGRRPAQIHTVDLDAAS